MLFHEILDGLKALVERIIKTETEMAALARNFAIKVPHCPLALYSEVEPARFGRGRDARPNPRFTGRPRGLYWGRVTRTHVVIHKHGRLNGGMIFKIALRQDRWEAEGEKRSRIEVVGDRVTFLGGTKKPDGKGEGPSPAAAASPADAQAPS